MWNLYISMNGSYIQGLAKQAHITPKRQGQTQITTVIWPICEITLTANVQYHKMLNHLLCQVVEVEISA